MPTIEVRIDDREVLAAVERLRARGADLSSAMADISRVLADAAEEAFETESDPASGAAWRDLSEVTVALRRKIGRGPRPILQVIGQLATSVQAEHGKDYAAAGSNKVYAAAHQFGMPKGYAGTDKRGRPIPWGDIPPRPYLGLGAEGKAEILDILRDFLDQSQ